MGGDDDLNLYQYAFEDPINNTDPTGEIVDTIADVAFIVADGVDIAQNGLNWENGLALGADVAGALGFVGIHRWIEL